MVNVYMRSAPGGYHVAVTPNPTTNSNLGFGMSSEVFHTLPGQGSTRIRVQAIDVELTSKADYPICLKILLNDQVHQRLDQVAVGQPLQWDKITPIDAKPSDYIELRAYEVHFWRKVRIGVVRFRARQVDRSSTELRVNDNTGLVPCSVKFTFPLPETVSGVLHDAYRSAAAAIEQNRNVMESMGKTRELVDTILKVTGQVSELNPITNVTLDLCKQAWETLQQQGECDRLVAELVINMGNTLSFVDIMKDKAKVMQLQTTIADMLHLIEDASRFVIGYKSDGAAVRAVRAFLSSTAQEQVDEFLKRFEILKQDFDRGMITQVVLGVEALLNDADREMLMKLITPDSGYDPSTGCLEGTRATIRNDIQQWVDNGDPSQSLFWLYGLAGCGKSSVARSVCKRLDETDHLGGSFFCKRDNEHLSKLENIVSTLAGNLAFACRAYGARLVAVLREKPQRSSAALAIRFRSMIMEPIEAIANKVEQQTLVIIIDALDECGTPDTRTQLLTYLLEMLQLTPWLKIIVTSRPNEELAGFFRRKGKTTLHRDLFQEDPASVFSDICLFIRARLAQLMEDDEALGGNSWLDDETVKQLATRANGLFIWARTACNVICNSVNPDEKIKSRLAGKASPDTNEQLGLLYTTVLNEALGGVIEDTEKIRCCIATVVITRIPLVDTALADLLAGRVNLNELRLVVRRLASVLYRDQSGAVRVVHQSFSDYMVDERCPAAYRMDPDGENIAVATSCLQIMVRELRFNICELKDSRVYNREISDLVTQIQAKIGPHLEYSCVYWANHLLATFAFNPVSKEHQVVVELLDRLLLGPKALYWVEILSLLGRLYGVESSAVDLMDWMQNPSHKLSIYADELQRFVGAFYLPVSQSTPHLYISALAFGSEQFDTIQALKDDFSNVVRVASGKHLGKLSNQWLRVIQHPSSVRAVACSANGKLLAAGSGETVQVWDARTGAAILNPLAGHSDQVSAVEFTSDGQYIVSGSWDTTVRVWDLRTGTAFLGPLDGHTSHVSSVAISSDGQYIVSGSRDMTVRVWDLRTGAAILNPLQGHSHWVTSVAISPDGQYIISGSVDHTVRLWDLCTGDPVLNPFWEHSNPVSSVAFSHDGHYIVTGSGERVHIWDRYTGAAALHPLHGHSMPVTSVATSPDGKYIVSGNNDKTVQVWDMRTGAAIVNPLQGHFRPVESIVFSPDSQHIISGSCDGTVRVWDLRASAALNSLQGHSDFVNSVAFSPDGQHIISGSYDKTVRVWGVRTGTAAVDPLQHSDNVTSVAFSPDGQYIVSGCWDKTVHVRSTRTYLATLDPIYGHSDGVTSVAISPSGLQIASGSKDKTVRVWDLRTGAAALNPLEGHSDQVSSVAFSPDGQRIVSGSCDGTVRVWDLHTGAASFNPLRGHSEWVTSVAISPDGQYIVSGSRDRTVRVWELRTGSAALEPFQGHSDVVECVAFSPDSQRVVSGSWDQTVRVWDLRTGTAALNPLQGHSLAVLSVAFSPNGRHIVSSSYDSIVRLWDISSTSVPLNDLPDDFPCSGFSDPVMSHQLANSLTLTHDGWVLDGGLRPLLWLPPQLQRRQADHSLYAISANPSDHPVSFDFSKFKCGSGWTSVRDETRI